MIFLHHGRPFGFSGTGAPSGGTEAVTTSAEEKRRRHGGGEAPSRGGSWSDAANLAGQHVHARPSVHGAQPNATMRRVNVKATRP